jgi:uncharacterized protein (DUF1800 family)
VRFDLLVTHGTVPPLPRRCRYLPQTLLKEPSMLSKSLHRVVLLSALTGAAALAAWAGREQLTSAARALTAAATATETQRPKRTRITTAQASRFLGQATFGPTEAEINALTSNTYDSWLNNQFGKARASHYQHVLWLKGQGIDVDDFTNRYAIESFWKQATTGQDQLRQRATWALSQIFVVGDVDNIRNSAYYDVLATNAFGNYRQLLEEVTLSPAMGLWLSHIGNMKEDPATGRLPDENYAREVMQLFSIGLWQLNPDGSRKLDGAGKPIPTYAQEDIRGMAKVLTGWSYANCDPIAEQWYCFDAARSGWYRDYADVTTRMQPLQAYHSPGEKRIVNGVVIPPGQSAQADLKAALDTLFNHPNVGPFIGRQLIQRLVKSNPSPAYIARITAVFNNNGSGVRGDLKAVIRAILLDSEARDLSLAQGQADGKLREPVHMLANYMRVFTTPPSGDRFDFNPWWMQEAFAQRPLSSPSVFNFYSPFYQPPGEMAQNNAYGPEFQILHEATEVDGYNFIEYWVQTEFDGVTGYTHNYAPFQAIAGNASTLVGKLDLLMTAQTLSPESRNAIVDAVNRVPASETEERVKMAIMLVLIAPDYKIQK